ALRQQAFLDHARQHPLTVRLVPRIELALVFVDVLLWCMVRRVVRAWTEPHEPGLRGVARLLVANHLQRLIREIPGKVISLVGRVRLFDELVVPDEIRIPLIRLTAEEPVVPIEALLERPLRSTRT